jgi:hypothetical protein
MRTTMPNVQVSSFLFMPLDIGVLVSSRSVHEENSVHSTGNSVK